MRKALSSICILLTIGCAEKTVWMHPNKGEEERAKDEAECRIFAKIKSAELTPPPVTFSPPTGNQQTVIISPYGFTVQQPPDYTQQLFAQNFTYGFRLGMLETELFRVCMQMKGYTLQKLK